MNTLAPLTRPTSWRCDRAAQTCVDAAGPNKPQAPVLPEIEEEESTDLATPWHVLIFNDPVNLMNYVTMIIQRIFGYSGAKARLLMLDVHQRGKCVAWTGDRERAEMYVRELQSCQLLSAMRKAND